MLFKYPDQTPSIDIWSIGIIFLTILTRQYPFFNSPDDLEAFVEIITIFGIKKITDVSKVYGMIRLCPCRLIHFSHLFRQKMVWDGAEKPERFLE